MSFLLIFLLSVMLTLMNPMTISITILLISIVTSFLLFKIILSSWFSFVLILTFSSGMMTLFVYASSLSPNETPSISLINKIIIVMMVPLAFQSQFPTSQSKVSMKMFSSLFLMALMTSILILTMLTISIQAYQPTQATSSSF